MCALSESTEHRGFYIFFRFDAADSVGSIIHVHKVDIIFILTVVQCKVLKTLPEMIGISSSHNFQCLKRVRLVILYCSYSVRFERISE